MLENMTEGNKVFKNNLVNLSLNSNSVVSFMMTRGVPERLIPRTKP